MDNETPWMEHRWGARVELQALAKMRTLDGRETEVCVRNASLSGAYVETPVHLPLLALLSLRPFTPDGEWMDACVVRADSTGVAIEWLEPGMHSIFTLLALRRETPPVLEDWPHMAAAS